ncbi:MAG: Prolyl oligopeptidase [Acidobacteria bacterium]|nr:Prolyl oligopeptidase [Acidobacteriota bacterium]
MIRADLVDVLHGVAVADPFRRLESAEDPETVAWVAAQNAETRRLLDGPVRDGVAARLRELHRVPRMSVPAVRGDRIFFTESDGVRAQPILYCAHGSGLKAERLVDPNLLDAAGTTAITAFEPDDTGARIVYGLSRQGSDAQELLIHDAAAGAPLGDRLQWVKFASVAWRGDGFFYTRYPEHEQYFCQVWYHRVGDPQRDDRLIYHRPDAPEITFDVKMTSDGRQLVIASYQGASDHAEIHIVSPDEGRNPRPLVTGFAAGWHFIDGRDDQLYFRTDADAPFGRIVRFDLRDGTPEGRRDNSSPAVIVPESRDTIVDAAVANGRLLVSSLRNASSRLASWSLDGAGEREIALPGIGTINGLGARWTDARAFAAFTSFTTPPVIMACSDAALTPIRQSTLPFDPADYVTEQVWYASKDGTPVSMFLVSRGDTGGGGDGGRARQACLLTGYGGFNISLTPSFDPSDFVWLDAGGTIAVANLRGGGEYGDAWHRAGMRERKQNVFDDFIAAAEWLEASGRARRGRVAIEGASNGGLLVGACLVQRPDLFGAAICRVPVADMLRYHLFTVGRFWIPEYGCADEPDDFPFLLRYSPYHNVANGTAYPPTLVMTADTDDRVAPGMAKKFAARLQEEKGGPVLLRVETRAGHGAGKPLEKQVAEQADSCAFLFHYLTRTSGSEQMRPPIP